MLGLMQEEAEQQQQDGYEVEPWLVEFANLFRDHLGIEPDRHLDLTNIAWEKLQSAVETAVLDDKAPDLFDQAVTRFQEVTAHGKNIVLAHYLSRLSSFNKKEGRLTYILKLCPVTSAEPISLKFAIIMLNGYHSRDQEC